VKIKINLSAFVFFVLMTFYCNLVYALTPSPPPFDLGANPAYFLKDIAYGTDPNHKLDVFLPKAQFDNGTAVPLVIYIHGGGFTSGSKESIYGTDNSPGGRVTINALLANQIAFISINYPLLVANDTEGVKKSLNGSKRALQYIRRYANSLKIIPNKIIVMGSSAGASTALWLAFHDDMKNPTSADLTETISTRVLAAIATETQSTLDVVKWESIFSSYNISLNSFSSVITSLFGISRLEDLYEPQTVLYRQDVDLLGLMDSSDPEVWVQNKNRAEIPKSINILYHHPYHAKALRDQALLVNLPGVFNIPELGINDPSQESVLNFILRKFQ
jgi:pimeloyl-ACP methyl ester carboxylesterase